MPRCLLLLFAVTLTATAGCERQPSAKPPTTKGNILPAFQQPNGHVQPVAQGPKVELGDSEQRPVIFFELRTGMVIRISELKYDNLGWVDSYVVSVQPDKGEETKVLVRTETPAGGGMAPIHAATVNGKPVPRQSDQKVIGFSVKDTGGVVLARSGGTAQTNIQTKFSYDPTGRQEVAQQDFQHEGKTFGITYSEYRRETSGRLAGYTAQVVKAE